MVQANIITPKKKKGSRQIWAKMNKYFASNNASNRARMFKDFLQTLFSYSNIIGFIKETNTAMSQLHEVGINFPPDIIGYFILGKLLFSMDTVIKKITHLNKKNTPNQVLGHL